MPVRIIDPRIYDQTVPDVASHLVLVTGLFSPRWVMFPMARRLRRLGHTVSIFSRSHPRQLAATSAQELYEHLQAVEEPVIHLVAHSFGGIVLLHLFDQFAEVGVVNNSINSNKTAAVAIGGVSGIQSVVLIASPVLGSDLAHYLSEGSFGFFWKRVLGKSLQRGLLGDAPRWNLHLPVGFITGGKKSLLGRLLRRDAEQGDGLVRHSETLAAGKPAEFALTLNTTHGGLVYSSECCRLINQFVTSGSFSRPAS